jgi:hypothetical protein
MHGSLYVPVRFEKEKANRLTHLTDLAMAERKKVRADTDG